MHQSFHKHLKTVISVLGEKNIKDIFFFDKYIIATDGSITIKVVLSENVKTAFKLPANIAKMLQNISDDDIAITYKGKYIEFSAQDKHYKTEFIPAINKDLPNISVDGFNSLITLPFCTFAENVSGILPIAKTSCISSDISGVSFASCNEQMQIMSGSQYCIALNTVKSSNDFKFNLNEKNLKRLLKTKFNNDIEIMQKGTRIAFVVENFTFFIDAVHTINPNISSLYGKYLECSTDAEIDRKKLLAAVKRLNNVDSKKLHLVASESNILVDAEKLFSESIAIENGSLRMDAVFNINYICAALKALGGKTVIVKYYDKDAKFITISSNNTVWMIAAVVT